MGVVVLGDVGAKVSYHVGDEAMTEYALAALAERGLDDVTVMASNVKAAAGRFGRGAVPRFGFEKSADDTERARRHDEIVGSVSGGPALRRDDPAREALRAIEAADGVLVCGGGNIASQFPVHLQERLVLAEVARRLGKPVVITSQTLGPMLKPHDVDAVGAMLASADLVGAREASSYALALELGARPERTAHGIDDAFCLEPSSEDEARVDRLGLPAEFALAAFTGHAGSTGWSREENQRRIAETLEQVASELSMPVLLVAHVGSLVEHRRNHDQLTNDAIDALTSSAVTGLPMLTAGEVVALTRRAALSISSRYHPTVFGPAAGVPSVAITQSVYSSVKIGGAMRNVGLGDYAIPAASWRPELVVEAARFQMAPETDLAAHLAEVTRVRRDEARSWWDAVAACLEGRGVDGPPTSLSPAPALAPRPPWEHEVRVVAEVSDAAERTATEDRWDIERLRGRVRRLKAKQA